MSSSYVSPQANLQGSFSQNIMAGKVIAQELSINAGAVVQQITSRTTAIPTTFQKGSIKLFSVANIATIQDVTITNPFCVVGSVPVVAVVSSTDRFLLQIKSVTTGSFVLSFTASSTTAEAPVFSYVIL